jgi:hypothetical protein
MADGYSRCARERRQTVPWAPLTLCSGAALVLCAPVPAPGSVEAPDDLRSAGIEYAIERPASAAQVRDQFTDAQVRLLEKLNRADRGHLHRLDALIVPRTWDRDVLAYSPFPTRYAWGARQPKLLVVHQPSQAFAAYDHGRLVR